MGGPGAGLDQPQCRSDELLDVAEGLLGRFAPLIDLSV